MTTSRINRRTFLKTLAGAAALVPAVQALHQAHPHAQARQAGAGRPNILVVVFDTLSAEHMSVYGYPRDTTPHLARFAEQANVYHRHYAAGNFTTPGTASLLTGTYPWSHRAFNISAPVAPEFTRRSLFAALAGAGYQSIAYTHNLLADYFLHQFRDDIDLHLTPETFFLAGTPALDQVFRGDPSVAYRSGNFITRVLLSERTLPGSLFLSLINEMGLEQFEATFSPHLAELFPDGLPEEINQKAFFLLEHAIDGMIDLIKSPRQPFLAYFHLYPPHHPYHPRREFIGRFSDGWAPEAKPQHFFSTGEREEDLNDRRGKYDDYLAYADSEFGRFYDYLNESGLLENTWVVFTSDHGEMFERGIKGHNTPVLYDALVRVPLLVHRPGQRSRVDIHTPTSCVDLVPTLAQAGGQPVPDWCEGRPFPLEAGEPVDPERAIYALDARRNGMYRPLKIGTIAMVKDRRKLIAYYGYPGFDKQYELYDIQSDPEERQDLSQVDTAAADLMKSELEVTLNEINRASRGYHVS